MNSAKGLLDRCADTLLRARYEPFDKGRWTKELWTALSEGERAMLRDEALAVLRVALKEPASEEMVAAGTAPAIEAALDERNRAPVAWEHMSTALLSSLERDGGG